MIGIAESLRDGDVGPMSEEQQYNLTLLTQSGKRLANLVNDILDYSRLRHRELNLALRPVSVRQATEIVLQLNRSLVGSRDVQVINEVPATLPFVFADEDRLHQILHNLVGNAIKFTHSGVVKVSSELILPVPEPTTGTAKSASIAQIAVSVADTESGFPRISSAASL